MDEVERLFKDFLKRAREDPYDPKKMWLAKDPYEDKETEHIYEVVIKDGKKYKKSYTDVTIDVFKDDSPINWTKQRRWM